MTAMPPPKPSAYDIIQAAQASLTAAEYEAWWYCDAAGLSTRKAAAWLSISRSTLRSRLERARPKVAAELERYAASHGKSRRAKAATARRSEAASTLQNDAA